MFSNNNKSLIVIMLLWFVQVGVARGGAKLTLHKKRGIAEYDTAVILVI